MRRGFAVLLLVICALNVSGVSCDCHPGGTQNRVCLYTDPQALTINPAGYFDFAVKLRNFFRTETGAAITDITTTVVSCTKSGGSACTWSESGDTDFQITINPEVIPSSLGGLYNTCGIDPASCRICTQGRLETINSRITVNEAGDGTYTIRYRVGWQPRDLERFIDVTITFSSGGCTNECSSGQRQCSGTSQYEACGQSGDCWVWGSAQSCGTGQICCGSGTCQNPACTSASSCGTPATCKQYTCSNAGTCTAACSLGNVADGTSCATCGGPTCSCQSGSCTGSCTDTCSSLGYQCGSHSICGSSANCGSCPTGQTCNSQGKCVTSCTDTCSSLGYECGSQTICGSSQSCGSCSTGQTCSGGDCVTACTDTCSTLGYLCGSQTVCGATQSCGSCSSGQTCTQGKCVTACTDTCSSLGYLCGTQTICGSSQSCGSCGRGSTCSQGHCTTSCTDTCETLGLNCGSNQICGKSVDCGSCARGTQCVSGRCTSKADLNKNGCIEDNELISFILDWIGGKATIENLNSAIKAWKYQTC